MPKTALPKSWTLVRSSISMAWQARRSLAAIILVVMVPVVIINIITSNDQTFSIYASVATLVMNLAVLTTVVKLGAKKPAPKLAEAYYEGTKRFVPFVLASALLALQTIPLILGGLVYVSGSQGSTLGLGVGEMILLGILWLLIGLPTFRWLTRSVFALYFVQDAKVRPVAAVKQSWQLVRGRSWRVFGRFAVAAIISLVILFVPSLALSGLGDSSSWVARILTNLLQLATALVLVPFMVTYGYKVMEALGGKPRVS